MYQLLYIFEGLGMENLVFFCHLVHFMAIFVVIWYIFPNFGTLWTMKNLATMKNSISYRDSLESLVARFINPHPDT
jgi:hypothetical protein